jgi:hypothetical protein
MIASGNFSGGIGSVFNLRSNIPKQLAQTRGDLRPRHADVLFRASLLTCPFPSLIEHAFVHFVNERILLVEFALQGICAGISPAASSESIGVAPAG